MFAVFLTEYNYTAKEALAEYAQTFFALCGQMYRIQASRSLLDISNINAGSNGGKEADSYVSQLKKQAQGQDKLIEEAKTIRRARSGK